MKNRQFPKAISKWKLNLHTCQLEYGTSYISEDFTENNDFDGRNSIRLQVTVIHQAVEPFLHQYLLISTCNSS